MRLTQIAFLAGLLAASGGRCLVEAQSPTASVANQHGGARVIDGVLLSAKTGAPLANAEVTLTRTKDRAPVAETITDTEGRFSFAQLPDGKFSLRGARRGFISAAYEQHENASTAIVTGEGLVSTGLQFKLTPQAVIFGTVTEDSGDPIPQANIKLYRQDSSSGAAKVARSYGSISDEQGNFELTRLEPGNYFLAVTAKPWYATHSQNVILGRPAEAAPLSPLDVAYPTTFYPDATDAAFATPITVNGGDRVPVNVTLHAVPAIHITLPIPASGPNHAFNMPQLRQDVFGSDDYVQAGINFITNGEAGQPPTAVELSGIAPGHYEVGFPGGNGEIEREASVELTSDMPTGQALDFSSSTTLAEVSGKFASAGEGTLPESLYLLLTAQQGDRQYSAPIAADGSFQIHSVKPGTYEMTLNRVGYPLAVTQLIASGATVEGPLLKIGGEPVTMAGLVAETKATVSGVVQLNGKPASGVFVVLVPAQARGAHDDWRTNQSDSDGSFDFPHVLPGRYTAVAIQEGWTIDWARPEAIARYMAGGVKVTVPSRASEITLKEPVEAQLK